MATPSSFTIVAPSESAAFPKKSTFRGKRLSYAEKGMLQNVSQKGGVCDGAIGEASEVGRKEGVSPQTSVLSQPL